MIQLFNQKTVVAAGEIVAAGQTAGIDIARAAQATLAARILAAHNRGSGEKLAIRFDALASHDITYVSIIQTARAAGIREFPMPYVLTNCHNSLCAVGGTINEDDHVFGLMAAKKYGGIFVPAHLAVIHQYMREMMASCGGMILGSDSHTRYGALGTLAVGEGGPELVKQLVGGTWDIERPEVIAIWLEGEPQPGVGPQDVALAIIGAVFPKGFVKNKIVEFMGPGIAPLSIDYRNGIDVMTTEMGALSSIWPTDNVVKDWLELHGRGEDFRELKPEAAACYDGLVKVDLCAVKPMIALPFHPANVHTIEDFNAHARELLAEVDAEDASKGNLKLVEKIKNGAVVADQGIIAGCAGGTFENISHAAAILGAGTQQRDHHFNLALYPASVPVASALINNGATEKLMTLGAIMKTAFCGPCFGAGDTPAHGALSLRHTTRNFPHREGSRPGDGQMAAVALMDSRSVAASAANGGRITPATELDWSADNLRPDLRYRFNAHVYGRRVYNGFGKAEPDTPMIFGPNIADWPQLEALPEHLILQLASVILDPVTTTDELIPSGETSSLRSNPLKLAEHTLERKDPQYVGRAKAMQEREKLRLANPGDPELLALVKDIVDQCATQPVASHLLNIGEPLREIGLGTVIFAVKPGDGSAREQAASSQRVLGTWANLAEEYATRRYRSNLINWGMLPFRVARGMGKDFKVGDYLVIPNLRAHVADGSPEVLAVLLHGGSKPWAEQICLVMDDLTADERKIILSGCLTNYMARQQSR